MVGEKTQPTPFAQPLETVTVSLWVFGPLGGGCWLGGLSLSVAVVEVLADPPTAAAARVHLPPPGPTAVVWFCIRGAEKAGLWPGDTDLGRDRGDAGSGQFSPRAATSPASCNLWGPAPSTPYPSRPSSGLAAWSSGCPAPRWGRLPRAVYPRTLLRSL